MSKIYAKKRDLSLVYTYLHLKTSVLIIQKWNKKSCIPYSNLVLDQGVIFKLVKLHKEGCISSTNLMKDLHSIKPLFDKLIFLTAPIDILYKRVQNRPHSDARGQKMNFEEFDSFCSSYAKSFQLIHKIGIPIIEINTSQICSKEVHDIFYKVFYER